MPVDINYRLLDRQGPTPSDSLLAGFQQGRALKEQRAVDQAQQAFAADPNNPNALANLIAIDPQRGKNALAAQQLMRDETLRNSLMSAYDAQTGEIDPAAARKAYLGAGDVAGAMQFDKGLADSRKTQLESMAKQIELSARLLGAANDPVSYNAARQQAAAIGLDISTVPERYDPQWVQQARMQALDAKQQIDAELARERFAFDRQDRAADNARAERDSAGLAAYRNASLGLKRAEMSNPKPPSGYRYKADGSLEAIPGGPAEIKVKSRERLLDRRKKTASIINNAVDRAINLSDENLAAGLGSGIMRNIGGSSAKNLEATLRTIKANLGFEELQAMREASPTGGALGQVAVQELEALQSTVAALDQGQSDDQLRANLRAVKEHYKNWVKVIDQANAGAGGGGDDGNDPLGIR